MPTAMSPQLVTSFNDRSQRHSQSQPQTRNVLISRLPVTIGAAVHSPPRYVPNNRIVTSKYTVLNFVPKNLFEQFRRIANFYFLCIAVIQVTTNSPVSPITSLAPLIFVVSTTALKQGYEDYLRHKMDRATNNRMFPVLRAGGMKNMRSEEIEIGDIISVKDHQEIPCDMVLISSVNSSGKCHVTTANLDGETNLKVRECLDATKSLQTPESLNQLKGVVECEKPNSDLYEFIGTMRLPNSQSAGYPLGPHNLLVRGSRLQNTNFVYGIAVYTGPETKLALNSRLTSNKFSSVEKTANRYLIAYLTILVAVSATFTGIRFAVWNHPTMGTAWYFKPLFTKPIDAAFVFEEFFAFFVIFNYVIPISLYVTLETVKFFGSKTLVNDPALMDPDSRERPRCNSSDLNEELGQVEYLFSDKTGTLTENKMRFTSCVVGKSLYEDRDERLIHSNGEPVQQPFPTQLLDFFVALALCNTVRIEPSGPSHVIKYSADSPDEKALVEAANRYGVSLIESNDNSCTISIANKRHVFKKLQTLEFDSTRKRSSVIFEDETGKISLVCKGAESELLSLMSGDAIQDTYRQIDQYAAQGLRTLVLARKELTREEYNEAAKRLESAHQQVHDRKNEVMKAQISIEQKLTLVGATAVEDKLQDGVTETIRDLRKAGIKIWVLTGDKLETAVSVATSCGLIDGDMERMILARQKDSDSCGEVVNRYVTASELDGQTTSLSAKPKYLIVDGRSLHLAMKHHLEKFKTLCSKCSVVVCCRMSPIQKAEVVRMVKMSRESPVTAAIGDGANDVSMIQEAHVGFGLMGREGRQAVNAADFAFSRFRFLKPVLLVHGAFFYHRVSNLIHFFFYKNVIFVTPQVLFSFYNVFATQTLYHGLLLMLYNMMFTATPILCFGIGEQHLPRRLLLEEPELYKTISRNRGMRVAKFLYWFANGAVHGILTFYFFVLLWSASIINSGMEAGLFAFGLIIFHAVVVTTTLKLFLMARQWTGYFMACSFLSVASLFVFLAVYTSFKWTILDDNLFGIYITLLTSPSLWLALIVCPVVSLLPDLIYLILLNTARSYERQRRPAAMLITGET